MARISMLLSLCLLLGAMAFPRAQAQAPATADITFTKHIAPILQRSCENCHRRGADVAPHLRRGAAVGARHQTAHWNRPSRGRDAAVVRREEHRHPEVQER